MKTNLFWLGFVASLATRSLMEDIQGQESMIETYQHHWLSAWITGPIAIVALLSCIAVYVVSQRSE